DAGDVILLEQQIPGPGGQSAPVAVEWDKANYNAIVIAVGNGIHVVEAAGNGYQNLDGSAYTHGNGGHHPFMPGMDSGALLVGAGGAPGVLPAPPALPDDRSRLDFSNYGSRVDLQGWGELVVTTGYGDFYNAEGTNLFYTNFSGTSSASAIMAGV